MLPAQAPKLTGLLPSARRASPETRARSWGRVRELELARELELVRELGRVREPELVRELELLRVLLEREVVELPVLRTCDIDIAPLVVFSIMAQPGRGWEWKFVNVPGMLLSKYERFCLGLLPSVGGAEEFTEGLQVVFRLFIFG